MKITINKNPLKRLADIPVKTVFKTGDACYLRTKDGGMSLENGIVYDDGDFSSDAVYLEVKSELVIQE